MLQSMTGYGKATKEINNKKITVEIKTLNSKTADINARMPNLYRPKEIEIRNLLTQQLQRGKIEFNLNVEQEKQIQTTNINPTVVAHYYEQIKTITELTNTTIPQDIIGSILRLPDALTTSNPTEKLQPEDWEIIQQTIKNAIEQTIQYRTQEGKTLQKVFQQKIDNIKSYVLAIEPYEIERITNIKAKLQNSLSNIAEKIEIDNNRLEQELIYYIEKLDINEEKVRLSNNLSYFENTMENEQNIGKKLGFIAQEIGREINTLGSKSNHSKMQKLVVMMKDELEQIKEQVLNTL